MVSMTGWNELLSLKQEYVMLLEGIRQRIQRPISVAGVARIIGSTTCDGYAWHILQGDEPKRNFDDHWRSLHEEVSRRFIEVAVQRLCCEGRTVQVYSELPTTAGRFDVVIVDSGYGPLTLHLPSTPPPFHDILVEFKVGKSWSLEQIERYLTLNDARALVLIRLITSDAVKFRTENMLSFLVESLKAKIVKGKRVVDEQFILVPGLECRTCGRDQCHSNNQSRGKQNQTVLLSHEDFQMTPTVVGNMYGCINRGLDLVMEELSWAKKTSKSSGS